MCIALDTSRYLTESVQTVFHFAYMTNHPRQNWMNHCNMATARKAKKPIIHFGVKGQKKVVSVLCCFLLHIDLFTHSADMLAQGPSSHLYNHSTHGTLIKRLADRFTGITVNTSHQGQSILQSSILAYWILSGIDPGYTSFL